MADKKLLDVLRNIKHKIPSIGVKMEQQAIESDTLDKFYVLPKARLMLDEWIGYTTVFSMNKARDVKYRRKVKYCEDENLYLNICQPKERGDEKLPVFVYIHGGGWVSGRPEDREAFVSHIASAGFFTINIFYGLSPEYAHPKPLENIYKALEWLLSKAEKYNIDTSNIYVGGESAGAHLASMVGAVSSNEEYKKEFDLPAASKDLKFSGLVFNCGVYDVDLALKSGFKFINSYIYAYYGKSLNDMANDPFAKTMSPIHYVTHEYPRSFLITAENDPLKICGAVMREKFDKVAVEYVHFHAEGSTAVHAFAVAQVLDISKEVMKGILMFMGKEAEEEAMMLPLESPAAEEQA